jgi:hypothetical protein
VLAVAGFLLSVGQFLDKYHISNRTKDRARLLLVRGFVYLDSVSIPDAPRATLVFLRVSLRFAIVLYLLSLILAGLAMYWLFRSVPEIAISIVLTIAIIQAGALYASWIDILSLAFLAALSFGAFFLLPIISFVILRLSFRLLYDRNSRFLRFMSPVVSIFFALVFLLQVPSLASEFGVEDYVSAALTFAFLSPVFVFV